MKTISKKIALWALVMAFLSSITFAQTTYLADLSKSTTKWLGKKITGEHYGTISLSSGEFVIDSNGKLSKAKFVMDMNSIKNQDLTDAAWATKLEAHLKSEDFFNTAQFPTSTFEITDAQEIKKGNTVLKGTLTIRGVSKPFEFKSVIYKEGETYKVFGKMIIDRTQFGVKYGSGSFFESLGDKTIYDEFELYIGVVANKK